MSWRYKTMSLLRDDDSWNVLKVLHADHAAKHRPGHDIIAQIPPHGDPHRPNRVFRAMVDCGLMTTKVRGTACWYKLSPRGRQLVDTIRRFELAESK